MDVFIRLSNYRNAPATQYKKIDELEQGKRYEILLIET